jgi:hypothetical protein
MSIANNKPLANPPQAAGLRSEYFLTAVSVTLPTVAAK